MKLFIAILIIFAVLKITNPTFELSPKEFIIGTQNPALAPLINIDYETAEAITYLIVFVVV